MTGDPTRDTEATSHHWGGTDEPMEDEYAQHQRRQAERAEQCGRPLTHRENPHVSTPCGRPLLHDGDCHPVPDERTGG